MMRMTFSGMFIKGTLLVFLLAGALGCSSLPQGVSSREFTFSSVKWKTETVSPHSRYLQRNATRVCILEDFNEERGYFNAQIGGAYRQIYALGDFSPEQIISQPEFFFRWILDRRDEITRAEGFAAPIPLWDEHFVYDEIHENNACLSAPFVWEVCFFKRDQSQDESAPAIHFYRIVLWLSAPHSVPKGAWGPPFRVGEALFQRPTSRILAICIQEADE